MFPSLGAGIGLRPPHYERVLLERPRIDWLEVITENFLVRGGNAKRILAMARERYPLALHGVSLSIGSAEPLDRDYVDRLAALVREVEPAFVSDHLSWTTRGGRTAHDLWPIPYTEEALDIVVDKTLRVQDRLGRRILLENPSSYVTFAESTMPEATFLAAVAQRADCGILLDVNNLHVSATNHGFDARDYIASLPAERIGYVHLAGHDDTGALLLDTHDREVASEVWDLLREVIARIGTRPVLIERDAGLPPLEELVAEADRARAATRGVEPVHAA